MNTINELIASCFKPVATDSDEAIENAEWIKKVISSCKNKFHLEVAATLMEIYTRKYGINKPYSDLCSEYLNVQAMVVIDC